MRSEKKQYLIVTKITITLSQKKQRLKFKFLGFSNHFFTEKGSNFGAHFFFDKKEFTFSHFFDFLPGLAMDENAQKAAVFALSGALSGAEPPKIAISKSGSWLKIAGRPGFVYFSARFELDSDLNSLLFLLFFALFCSFFAVFLLFL
jgi:hypothetical protein